MFIKMFFFFLNLNYCKKLLTKMTHVLMPDSDFDVDIILFHYKLKIQETAPILSILKKFSLFPSL